MNSRKLLTRSRVGLLFVFSLLAFASSVFAQTDKQIADKLGISTRQVERLKTDRGLTSRELDQMSPREMPRLVRKLEYPDALRERLQFELLQQRNERGVVPPNALPRAIRQLDAMRARSPRARIAGMPTRTPRSVGLRERLVPLRAGLASDRWVALGPGNIGGRIRSIVVHPSRPATIWVGSVAGGIWRTDDGGRSFSPVNDLMANLAISSMVMDPTDANVIYAGTGEGFYNLGAVRGGGIFRTTDGRRWEQLPASTSPDFHYVSRLALSRDGAVLLASTQTGLFRSADRERRVWNRVVIDQSGDQTPLAAEITDVDFHPTNPLKAVAGDFNGKIYLSEDGGKTWRMTARPGVARSRVELTYARANPQIVYASVDVETGQIWRSADGGRTFTKMNGLAGSSPAPFLGGQGWYDNIIWAGAPNDANLVLVGGVDLWRSTDGGHTLAKISDWRDSGSAHPDHHAIVEHPGFNGTTNKTVFFGNDGGLYMASDVYTVGSESSSLGWTRLVNTLAITQFYGAAGNPSTGTIIGGAQDNGTLSYRPSTGSENWKEIFGGDGGWCAADPSDPNIFYGEYTHLDIQRNTNGATSDANWSELYISGQVWNPSAREWERKPAPFHIPDAGDGDARDGEGSLFIAPFILDPNNPNRMLAGGLSLWRTDNVKAPNTFTSGPAWGAIKARTGNAQENMISAIAVAKGNSDVVWVGQVNGDLYKTVNGTAPAPTWQRVDTPLVPNRYSTRITIDPRNPQIVYATFGGYARDNVWKTVDGGRTWRSLSSSIAGSLPEAPVRSLVLHPRNSNFVYIGTEVGVLASEDGGATWSPTNEGPTNCSVWELFWMGDTLVAATHGRGMFKISLPLQP